ncbi:TM2 domain-containing protein [Filimonas lacunae]|uniref:TM2 domain-containing protein n=1 Tax=Filimonas lacunae TaxID=477680 RepID=A0A173M9P6_9BACT|nr:TM2 domain-containing protein [Filimonas lacunae]BAV04263.1 hypothetical protein FLA_0244 [Filimonas lacunae]SIT13372.1 TM2 domain-containing protein [Filimonas lacunae]
MKKALLSLALACSISIFSFAAENTEATSNYYVNDSQVENMFATSADISEASPALLAEFDASGTYTAVAKKQKEAVFNVRSSDKNVAVALILNFFLGGLGVHRAYLGTETLTWVGYILTFCGIFGIVPLVDFIVLIVNIDDISEYEDNPKYFMW